MVLRQAPTGTNYIEWCRGTAVTDTAFAPGIISFVPEDTITISRGYFRAERMTKGRRGARLARKLTLCCLYPGILSACGDRGNLAAIVRRCGWHGIATEVRELRHGDVVRPDEADLILIGDGGDMHRRLIAQDLADVKGPGLREAAAQGAAVLAVGVGYQLLGRFYQPARGAELPGAGLFDAWTVEPGPDRDAPLSPDLDARLSPGQDAPLSPGQDASLAPAPAAGPEPVTGDLLIRWDSELLVGFEGHSARTYLGPTAQPLGQVIMGLGNNGDGREGALLGAAVGTYLRGPCLPWNPALTDFLIGAALGRRYGEADLEPLPDDLERAAHETAVQRIHIADAAALADAQA